MKFRRIAVMTVVLALFLGGSVYANGTDALLEEQWNSSGASSLYDSLPDETKDLLSRLQIDAWTWDAMRSMDTQTVWSMIADVMSEAAHTPWTAAMIALGCILVLGLYRAISPSSQGEVVRLMELLSVLMPLLIPLWQTVERAGAAAESASVFCLSFAPVYAGILTAQGNVLSAASYQSLMLAAAQGGGVLIGSVIVPLSAMALALGLAGCVCREYRIGDAALALNKAAIWLIGITMTVFVGMLSIQGIVSASSDSVGGRMMRFSVSGFVPIVGGALSEALYTVRGCLSAVRGTVGGLGLLCVILIALPTWAECLAWGVVLFLIKTTASLFGLSETEGALSVIQGVLRTLHAVLASSSVLMIVSVTVLTLVGGGR